MFNYPGMETFTIKNATRRRNDISIFFWNLKTNIDGDADNFDGISDLNNFKTWITENHEDITTFSNIEDFPVLLKAFKKNSTGL